MVKTPMPIKLSVCKGEPVTGTVGVGVGVIPGFEVGVGVIPVAFPALIL